MSSTLASGSLYYTASSLTQPTVQVDINAAAEKSFAAINNNSLESTSTKNRFSSCFLLLPPPLRRVPKKKTRGNASGRREYESRRFFDISALITSPLQLSPVAAVWSPESTALPSLP